MMKKVLATSAITLILITTFASILTNSPAVVNAKDGTFSGKIYDYGLDTDSDGLYNFLVVEVELNISEPGYYNVQIDGVTNEYGYYLYLPSSNNTYLDAGAWNVSVQFNGIAIYGWKYNPAKITQVAITHGTYYENYMGDYPLSNPYSYTLFDTGAILTGIIHDEGIDTDSDGLLDYLQIGVEIDVNDTALYQVSAYGLRNESTYVSIYNSTRDFLLPGIQVLNVSLYGPIIYNSQIANISFVSGISLEVCDWYNAYQLDQESDLLLSKPYSYTDFEMHAILTRNISDRGVDTDGDGLFDYLEIGIEVDVAYAGNYMVSAGGLLEQENSTYSKPLYVYQSTSAYFDVGVHTVYMSYEGVRLAYERFSPTNITDIGLIEQESYMQLDYIQLALLSKKYNYTLFDSPLKDIQVNFTVYPNGTLEVGGSANLTHIYPKYTGPLMNATVGFSTSGDLTTGSASGTVVFPKSDFQWPYNSTVAYALAQYDPALLNASLGVTVFMPPEQGMTYPANASDFSLNSKYSNGVLDVELSGQTEIPASMLPFNITDLVLLADYAENKINGNITFRAASGFPLGDILTHLNGNKTDLYLTGHVNVTYGNLFGIEINSTILDAMLANFTRDIPGPTGLVYNMTGGFLECTQFDTAKIPWTGDAGADVQYNVTIHGNFTGFIAKLLTGNLGGSPEQEPTVYAALDSALSSVQSASLTLNYYKAIGTATLDLHLASDVKALWSNALELVPPALPPSMPLQSKTQIEALLTIANATAYAIQDFSLNVSYSSSAQKLDLDAMLLTNVTQLKNDIIPILPNTVPLELREAMKSFVNTTYCTLNSTNATFNYVNGTANFDVNWALQGDLKEQTNHARRFYIDYLNATSPWMLTWQYRMLNETEIDVRNFKVEVKMGENWLYMTFNGLIAQPPKDDIEAIRFRLYRFFNMTSEDPEEPPRDFEKLKITLMSGFNGTHTILLYAPDTVPTPDVTSLDYKTMTWQNVTISSLKDVQFRIAYQGVIDYLGKTYYVPIFTNSTVSNFNFNSSAKSISFNVTGTTGTGFSDITIPSALLYAAVGNWTVKIDGSTLTSENFSATENAEYVFINLNYSHSEHLIEIVGTWIVPEFQPNILPLILAILSLIVAIIAVKQRKKLSTVKTKYHGAIHTFINRLHELKA